MQLKYGNYTHPDSEATVVISASAEIDSRNRVYQKRHRWDIAGYLQASTQALLKVEIDSLVGAYGLHGRDLIFYDNAGNVFHSLLNVNTIGGVRVVNGVNFPESGENNAEASTYRRYTMTVEADVSGGLAANTILEWQEVIDIQGGGPRDVFTELISGSPHKERVNDQTVYRATQTGSAVGWQAYPIPPSAIWPSSEMRSDRKGPSHGIPKLTGSGSGMTLTHYPIEWGYSFASAGPLTGLPNLPPN